MLATTLFLGGWNGPGVAQIPLLVCFTFAKILFFFSVHPGARHSAAISFWVTDGLRLEFYCRRNEHCLTYIQFFVRGYGIDRKS